MIVVQVSASNAKSLGCTPIDYKVFRGHHIYICRIETHLSKSDIISWLLGPIATLAPPSKQPGGPLQTQQFATFDMWLGFLAGDDEAPVAEMGAVALLRDNTPLSGAVCCGHCLLSQGADQQIQAAVSEVSTAAAMCAWSSER